jgi:hypothetical protein
VRAQITEVGAKVAHLSGQLRPGAREHLRGRADPVRRGDRADILEAYALRDAQRGDRVQIRDLDPGGADPEPLSSQRLAEAKPGEDVLRNTPRRSDPSALGCIRASIVSAPGSPAAFATEEAIRLVRSVRAMERRA